VQEGAPGLRVGQGRVPARHLRDVGARSQAHPGENLPQGSAEPEHALARDQRQDELGAGQRGGAQKRVNLTTEAAAGDHDQALAEDRILVGELHRDAATQRVADDRGAAVTQRDQQIAHAHGVGAEGVIADGLGGLAMTQEVGRHDGVVLREDGRHVRPLLGRPSDPVDQENDRSGPRGPVAHPVPVELDLVRRLEVARHFRQPCHRSMIHTVV
jgi:hypothetical protein